MNFSSWQFILVFLPLVIVSFILVKGEKQRQGLLIVASIIFYGFAGLNNLKVFCLSIISNYIFAIFLLFRFSKHKKIKFIFLWIAIFFNIALLLFFKINAVSLSGGKGFSTNSDILIPLGISFFTFQQIGFIVSCYQNKVKGFCTYNYLFFITFFPQLIMGPIVKYSDINSQLNTGIFKNFSSKNLAIGLAIFSFGLAKKALLADLLAVPIEHIYILATTASVNSFDMLYAIVGFQFQLFFDFSAYADMAIGLALIFGINLPINFDRPLRATSRFDLWRRWHITFITFMKSYVFMPLIRTCKLAPIIALFITGMLSGLWHGLSLSFALWGGLQTLLMLLNHYRNKYWPNNIEKSSLRTFLAITFTFSVTCLMSGIIFRTPTIEGITQVTKSILYNYNLPSVLGVRSWLMLIGSAFVVWFFPDTHQLFYRYWTALDYRGKHMRPKQFAQKTWLTFELNGYWAGITALFLFVSLLLSNNVQRFIYVQF